MHARHIRDEQTAPSELPDLVGSQAEAKQLVCRSGTMVGREPDHDSIVEGAHASSELVGESGEARGSIDDVRDQRF